MYLKEESKNPHMLPLFDHKTLLAQYIEKLRKYKSHEEKGRSFYEDYNIGGMLKVMQELIQNNPLILSEFEAEQMAQEIITKYLFTLDIQPIGTDITKGVELAAWEKPFINKCHSHNSRRAAFGLLQTICTNYPLMVDSIINNYFSQLL